MENESSLFRKNDFANIVKLTLGTFLFMSFAWMTGGVLSPLSLFAAFILGLVLSLCFYVPVLIARKIISESNKVGRALFVSFFGLLIILILATGFSFSGAL